MSGTTLALKSQTAPLSLKKKQKKNKPKTYEGISLEWEIESYKLKNFIILLEDEWWMDLGWK